MVEVDLSVVTSSNKELISCIFVEKPVTHAAVKHGLLLLGGLLVLIGDVTVLLKIRKWHYFQDVVGIEFVVVRHLHGLHHRSFVLKLNEGSTLALRTLKRKNNLHRRAKVFGSEHLGKDALQFGLFLLGDHGHVTYESPCVEREDFLFELGLVISEVFQICVFHAEKFFVRHHGRVHIREKHFYLLFLVPLLYSIFSQALSEGSEKEKEKTRKGGR
mmetsp:Transcript_32886/g.84925  ORF Transcript_32886/g.84925 Transcript_32886/m.84925 type:complete len:216 (-) Transcript_32886:29-676(-)